MTSCPLLRDQPGEGPIWLVSIRNGERGITDRAVALHTLQAGLRPGWLGLGLLYRDAYARFGEAEGSLWKGRRSEAEAPLRRSPRAGG